MREYANITTAKEFEKIIKVFTDNANLLYGVTVTIHDANSVWIFTTLESNRYILNVSNEFDEKFFECLKNKAIEKNISSNINYETVVTMFFNDWFNEST